VRIEVDIHSKTQVSNSNNHSSLTPTIGPINLLSVFFTHRCIQCKAKGWHYFGFKTDQGHVSRFVSLTLMISNYNILLFGKRDYPVQKSYWLDFGMRLVLCHQLNVGWFPMWKLKTKERLNRNRTEGYENPQRNTEFDYSLYPISEQKKFNSS
jgi:hypothetical protein